MFFVLGLSILLVTLLILNNAASLIALLLWKLFRRNISRWSAQRSAQALFLLRVLPAVLGIGAVLLLFAPAYLRHEPRVGHEDVSLKMASLALLSTIVILVTVVRGMATWRATRRLASQWLSHARLIEINSVSVPAYQVDHPFPLIAVVGSFRPRLFIASQIFEKLTPAELNAALEHENGHIRAHDNLKRTVVRACRGLSLISVGSDLDNAWLEASEIAADEFAARQDRAIGLDLASAIVKIARMIPSGARPAITAGAFLASEESAKGFSARVRRLVHVSGAVQPRSAKPSAISNLRLMIPAALTLLLFAITSESQILSAVHGVIEHTVHFLD
ncbi:MAG TPA: M56 family metallopeptidase [Pyrinomonadaceae bacterium]|nr:M56 family metallopeptidase [Pyrinomonadaceae bacterium]